MICIHTAGESHGPQLTIIIEGLPSGLGLTAEKINKDLARRQGGYGRGGRMAIETDTVEFVGGVRWGRTTGAPLAMVIHNKDWKNWTEGMSADPSYAGSIEPLTNVRPGHADLPGALKYSLSDARDVLERSSARETASRVAAGAVAKILLEFFDIRIGSFVDTLGGVSAGWNDDWEALAAIAEDSALRMADADAEKAAIALIDKAKSSGDTLGGSFVCFATGLPVGLGSHVQWATRLEGRIGQAILSIPAIKAIEFGIGFAVAKLPGSKVHDEIFPSEAGNALTGNVSRKTNRAGGLEGGITNGEPLWVRAAMKPIPTLMRPLKTVDLATGRPSSASKERSDVCAVPAASVVGEAMLAVELAKALKEKTGGDSVAEMKRNLDAYLESLSGRWSRI